MGGSESLENSSVNFAGSSSNPSTNVSDPFRYVSPPCEIQCKKKNIQSYFTPSPTSASANASQPSQTQPTLDSHWKKRYKEVSFEYIAKW
jgi:hypothetical protein